MKHIIKSKLVIIIGLLQLMLMSATVKAQEKIITVSGSVQFNEPMFKMSILRQEGNEQVTIAEFDIDKDNKFNYKLKIDKPGIYTLDCKKWESIQFWGEDEDISVDFRGRDTARIKIKNPPFHFINGGPKNEVINHLNFINYRNYQGMIAVSKITYGSQFLNDSVKNATTKQLYDFLNEDRRSRIRYVAEMYSDRTSVVAALKHLDSQKDSELIKSVSNILFSKYPDYPPLVEYFNDIKENELNAARMEIGAYAPQFKYPDVNGKFYGPSDFKGKVLLIDFWASWCGPCRAEIPNLKKVYEKYDRKDVEFLSVSIDKGKEEWIKALSQEKMPWIQVLAPKSGSEVSKLYQFSGIPFLVVLDKEGRIVSKYVRGVEEISKAIDKALAK
ncbi:MAG TPA: TlpA disulfide reductase family protein [Bacteroidales bacterium]|nr:TlpA disulfide reductase family protein [Bacteroidales bacterium]HRT84874.1 TlpA disulfide reductase family protein [Bacteroidales bacterium]